MANFYKLLNCPENASYEEIKKRYQELVRKSHPDKTTSVNSNDGEAFIQINEAWQTLRDPVKRKAYDAHLLAEQCESEHVLYATLRWKEMDMQGQVYTYPCRCGSLYSVPKDDSMNTDIDIYYQCSECSLGILIKSI